MRSPARAARRIRSTASARNCRRMTSELDYEPDRNVGQGKSTKKPPMPNKYSKLPAADLDALVAYMQSLK